MSKDCTLGRDNEQGLYIREGNEQGLYIREGQ